MAESSPIIGKINQNLPFRDRQFGQNPCMSHHAVRDLIIEIARAARYDGPSLSIGPSNNSLPRMNVRNGSDGLHLDPQIVEIWGFSGFRPHNRRDALKIHYGGWADLRKSD